MKAVLTVGLERKKDAENLSGYDGLEIGVVDRRHHGWFRAEER